MFHIAAVLMFPALSTTARAAEPRRVTPALDVSAGDGLVLSFATAYGGYLGGGTGYLLGEVLEARERDHTSEGIAPGALLGLAAGATTGTLLVATRDFQLEDAWAVSSGAAVGGLLGSQLGRAFITGSERQERQIAAGLAGSMAGTGVGILLSPLELPVGATLHFDLATGVGLLAGNGLSDLAGLDPARDRQVAGGLTLAGGAAFGAMALGFNQVAELEAPTLPTVSLAVGHGTWLGLMSPLLFSEAPEDRQLWGGAQVGAALGYASGLALVATGQPSPRSAGLQGLGIAAGNALGAGIPLALGYEGHPRGVVAPALATGVAGQVGAALLAPGYSLSPDDVFLVSALGTWTGLQTAGWTMYASQVDDSPARPLGFALTAGGAGTLITAGLAPVVDLPAASSVQLVASGGWGSWVGGWTGQLLDVSPEAQWMAALGGGNAALLGTAAAEGLGWQPSWRQVGTVNGMGLLGAAAGGLTGVVFLYDRDDLDPLVASTLVGSGVGLASGVALAALAPAGTGAAPTVRLPGIGEVIPTVGARPWLDEQGGPGGWVELRLDRL